MKHISIILSFLFFWSISFSQSIVQRSSTAITEQDGRLSAQLNLFIPRFLDTTQANLSVGIDSCGAQIYTYANDSYWMRACNPTKHWVKLLKTGDVAATIWGTITGTLSNQTDLQNALNLKFNISDTTNKWVQNVYQRNDSLFKFKNNIESFIHTFSPPITANNGLTETSNNIQLGGSLIQPTSITSAVGANRIVYSGVSSFADGAQMDISTSGSVGIAVRGQTVDGRGVLGVATTGVGVYGTATGSGGYGLFGLSTLGNAIYGRADSGVIWEGTMVPHSNNTIIPARSTTRASQALGANGIGYSDDSYLQTSTGSNRLSNQIIYKLTNATDASYASSFEFWNANNATVARKMAIAGNGQIILDQYTGTNFQTIDTSFNSLVVDGSGNVYKRAGDGSNAALSFTSMAALRAYDASLTPNNTYSNLGGFYVDGDGGGGTFVWDNTSVAADDSGTIIKSTPVTTGRWLRLYNSSINSFWFGAIPNGTRIVTNGLQNALNKTGHIIVPSSTRRFIIDNRLLIKSNTFFDIDPSDTLYLADSTNTVMIRNFTIDTTGITDHDITVRGGIWDNNWFGNPGTNAVSAVYKMLQSDKTNPIRGIAGTLDFLGIRNLKVLNLTVKDGLLFPIHITHTEYTEVGNILFQRSVPSISDGVHMSTPQFNFYIHDIAGQTGDDVVALGAWEWLIASPGGQIGDIKKGTIERVKVDTAVWSLVKMYTGNTGGVGGIYDVVIKDVKGVSKQQAFYWGTTPDQANPSHTTGIGTISNISMENVHAATLNYSTAVGLSFGSVIQMDCKFTNVVLKNLTMDTGYTPAASEPYLKVTTNASIKSLSIENFNQLAILPYGWLFDLDGQGDEFNLSNSNFIGINTFSGNQAYGRVRVVNTGAWSNIDITNNTYNGVAGALWQASTAGGAIVNLSSNIFRNYNEAVVAGAPMNLSLSGNQFFNGGVSVLSSYNASRVSSSGNMFDYVGAGVVLNKVSGTTYWWGVDMPVSTALTAPSAIGVRTGTASPIAALDVEGNDITSLTAKFGSFGIQSFSNTNGFVINNGYYDNSAGAFKYINNGQAAWLQFANGSTLFSSAPSGTAGASMTGATNNMSINNSGVVNINNLAGTGTRMVVASATGDLSTQTIGNTLYSGDGTLAGNRTVTGSNNNLTFATIGTYRINANDFVFSKNDGTFPYTTGVLGAGNVLEVGYTPTPGIYSKGTGIIIDTNNNASLGTTQIPSTAPLYATGGSTYVSGFQNQAGNFLRIDSVTTNITADLTQYEFRINATGGNVTITLPALSSAFAGSLGIHYVFKRLDSSVNTVTIQAAGANLIDGASSITLTTQYQVKELIAASSSAWDIQ